MANENMAGRLALIYLISVWFSLNLFASEPAWAGTVLGDMAAKMQPGQWAQITTKDAHLLLTPANGGNILEYANRGGWDPINKNAFVCGASHHGTFISRCVRYDESTNTWLSIGLPPDVAQSTVTGGESIVHAYDHNAVDTTRGHYYLRRGNRVHKYDPAKTTWSDIPTIPWHLSRNGSTCSAVTGVLEYFPDIDRLIYLNMRCNGDAFYFDPAINNWSVPKTPLFALGNGEYHTEGTYSNQGYVFAGGGNKSSQLWRLDKNLQWLQVASAPAGPHITTSMFVADPVSGRPLLFAGAGNIHELNPVTNSWTNTGISSKIPTPVAGIVIPISSHGVIVLVKADRAASAEVWLYKHASGSAGGDFTTRCNMPGVVRCFGFDSTADNPDLTGLGPNFGNIKALNCPSCLRPMIDTTIKASGAGSLKFTTPSQSGAAVAGSWFANFSPDLSTQFGNGDTFYVMYRMRVDAPAIRPWLQSNGGATGWKQQLIGSGDLSTCPSSGISFRSGGPCASSCSSMEIALSQSNKHLGPGEYIGCGFFYSFGEWHDGTQVRLQHQGPPYCYHPNDPQRGCFRHVANVWTTYKFKVTIGQFNCSSTHACGSGGSRIQIWAKRDSGEYTAQWQDREVLIFDSNDVTPKGFNIHNETIQGQQTRFGKIWLLPYMTNKNAAEVHEPFHHWFDELIISRADIPWPGQAETVSPPNVPRAPSSLSLK
jgi:hypothetical protein